jgi:hypothetical protein
MAERRRSDDDRRSKQRSIEKETDRRGKRLDRRTSLIERRQRNMDRRRAYDEFWMGSRDRRLRIMDRRNKDGI